MRETLDEFRALYKADKTLAESLTAELADKDHNERVELAAWTMIAHSLLNLEAAKVKR